MRYRTVGSCLKAISAVAILAAVLVGEDYLLSDNLRPGTHPLRSDFALKAMFHVAK